MTAPPCPPYSALKVWVKIRTSANSFSPRKNPEAPAGELPQTGSVASIPSIRKFVMLGRIPLIATCPALPLESNEGELLGLGATPGSSATALKRSRLSRGSSVRLCSGSSSSIVDVVLSIPATFALTVVCCERSPIASCELIVTSAAEVSSTPPRICGWNPVFSMRREYVPVGKPAKRYSPAVSVRALRFNPVPWLTIVALTPGTAAPLGSVMVPETVASWVCDHALTEKSATNTADNVYGRKLFLTWASFIKFRLVISSVLQVPVLLSGD